MRLIERDLQIFEYLTKFHFLTTKRIASQLSKDIETSDYSSVINILKSKFSTNNYCGTLSPIKLPDEKRFRHMVCQGVIGKGKTTFMANMIVKEINDGAGIIFIDPDGEH